jgi:hypothetical protein
LEYDSEDVSIIVDRRGKSEDIEALDLLSRGELKGIYKAMDADFVAQGGQCKLRVIRGTEDYNLLKPPMLNRFTSTSSSSSSI